MPSLPNKMCICQCSIVLGRFAYLSAACSFIECWSREIAGADGQVEKSKLTEPRTLDTVGRGSRNQSSPVASLTLDQL